MSPPAKARAGTRRRAAPREGTSSLLDTAYEEIKHRITVCAFRPGDYLNEAEISSTLGIGRTPVHQALDRLMIEGLVQVMPRKGIIVKPVSLDEALQTIEVRLLNESYCVRLAADRASANEMDELTAILDRAQKQLATRDGERLMRLDREFHGVLARSARNPVLAEQLGRLHDRSLRFWILSLNTPGHHLSVQQQHLAILAAIRDRDPDGAEQAMRAHIEAFRRNLLQTL
jgi:GntR family transcriptional regulator, rspAB operon transcriptional repressor